VVFTGPREAVERAVAAIDGAAVVGEIANGSAAGVVVLGADGNDLEVTNAGWEHLSA